jgi:hypothetical protein
VPENDDAKLLTVSSRVLDRYTVMLNFRSGMRSPKVRSPIYLSHFSNKGKFRLTLSDLIKKCPGHVSWLQVADVMNTNVELEALQT